MNKIFKVIWNKAKHCYVVASELAKSYSKNGGSRSIRRAVLVLGVAAVYAATGIAMADNSGGHVAGYDYVGDLPYNVTIVEDVTGSVYGRKETSETSEEANVTISSGNVNQNIFGGWSNSGNAASNSVNINGDSTNIFRNIYGGVASDTGYANYNQVNINSGTVKYVYGGYSQSGEAASNSVIISGGTMQDSVYGGNSYSSSAYNNSVNVNGGIVESFLFGGKVENGDGDAASNSVSISGGTVNTLCGGGSDRGVSASNSVNISGDTIVNGEVFGGHSYLGNAASNSVNISGGTLNFAVYGGYIQLDTGLDAIYNSVNISGGTILNSVYGGVSESGNAASNSVNISGGTVKTLCGGSSYSGVSSSNSVNISGDTIVNGEVFGGSSNFGDAIYNSVNISGGTIQNSVYGGVSESGNAASNSVTISGGTVKKVFGGGSNFGDAVSNSVTISGGNFFSAIYGGVSLDGDNATSNSVIISNGTVNGSVYGGFIRENNGSAASNSVNISGGTVNGSVYGGYLYEGSGVASNNSVNISSGEVHEFVSGGYVDRGLGSAYENNVSISGGKIGKVYGGGYVFSSGSAYENKVSFSGGKTYAVYGGASDQGNVASNSVTISDGTVSSVYGGYSHTGYSASNSVNISGENTKIEDNVYGGYVEVSQEGSVYFNSVDITGGIFSLNSIIYGGYAGNCIGGAGINSVNIDGITVNSVYGGYSESGNVTSNSVNIKGVTVNSVYGGYSISSDATSNTVNMIDGTVDNVYGGQSNYGDVASNTVNIKGGTVNQSVYGGYSPSESHNSRNVASNSVYISGDTTSISGSVYGGYFGYFNHSDLVTENKVSINSGVNVNQNVYGGYADNEYGIIEGNLSSNSVYISGDTTLISGSVYGGYINNSTAKYSSVSNNFVSISGGKTYVAYGGYANGSGDANENQVTMTGGEIAYNGSIENSGCLFGGWSNFGNAASNSVYISGDTTSILGNIYGGVANDTGYANCNQVNISSGTLHIVYGGYSQSGSAASNSVNISGGIVESDAYGGYVESGSGDAASNSVNIISGKLHGSVYGGYVESGSGASTSNSVKISSGTVYGDIYGGHSQKGCVSSNSVNISNGIVYNYIYGGSSYSGKVASNSVNIIGGTVGEKVYGGYSGFSGAASNSVNICGGTVNSDVYGGYVYEGSGNATNNSVNISGDTTNILGNIYGGVANDTGYANYNQVNISSGTLKIVYGGWSNSGNAVSNSVNISGGSIYNNVYGGYSDSGNVTSNSVIISGGTIQDSVYGGFSDSGNAASNSVNISGGTFGSGSNIYAGYVCESNNSSISDNVVNLGGTVTELNNTEIYGYYFANGSGTHSGNELHLGGTKTFDSNGNPVITNGTVWQGKTSVGSISNKVKTIANFETIALHSVTWNETLPALAAESFKYDNSIALGGNVTLDITSLTFDKVNASGTMTLLQSDTAENFSGIKLKYSDSEAVAIPDEGQIVKQNTSQTTTNGIDFTYETEHSISLADSNKKINYTIVNGYKKAELGSLNWSDGGQILLNTDSIFQNSFEVSLGTDFNIEGSENQEDDAQLTLLDLSQTSGSLKDAIDTTKIVDISKNATSEMTFKIAREDSIKSDSEKKKLIYTVGKSNTVAEVVFDSSIDWNSETPYYSNTSFDFTNAKKIDASKLEFRFTNDQLAELSEGSKITLVSNATNQAQDVTVTYKNNGTDYSQQIDYSASNGVVFSGTMNGDINALNSSIEFTVSQNTLDSIDISDWDAEKEAAALLDSWSVNTDGVMITATDFNPTVTAGEKTILTASTNVFKDENIDDSIKYKKYDSFEDRVNAVNISGYQTGGVKSSDDGMKLTYHAMFKDVYNISFGDMKWGEGSSFGSNGVYDFKNVNKIDATGLKFNNPEIMSGTMDIIDGAKNLGAGIEVIGSTHKQNFDCTLENKTVISATLIGEVSVEAEKVKYALEGITINKFDFANWDGENSAEINNKWKVADGANVDTDGMSNLPDSDEEKQVFILKSDTDGYFAKVVINGENAYRKWHFTDSDEKESVTLDMTQEKGITFDEAKKNLIYKIDNKYVTSIKLSSINFKDGAELLSRDKYNYSKLTSLDTNDFKVVYEKPEMVSANQSMTLLKANDTLADIAAVEDSHSYNYTPVSGVFMDAKIRSSLEAKNGKVTLTALSNKADKLTFGNVEWLDKGSLINHKTTLNNISFDGADIDTSKIAFINKHKLDADMQLTLVSDFGKSVGTITGSKYKVGTAYEGEGSAYLDGNDLIFKTKTGAGLSDETHTTVMSMEAGIAALAAGNDHIGIVAESLGMAANKGSDGVSTAASVGGASSRYKTGSHVDTNSWNIALAVGKNLEKKDGTLEYGLFAEYGRGNYTLHMNGIEDAGSGNTHYTGGGLLLKWTNSYGFYTEGSFRMGNMKDNASSILHDGAGIGYGYDKKAKYRGCHFGFGKKYREDDNTELEVYSKFFYNQRDGINFAAGADQYSLDEIRSRVLRAGFRLVSSDRKWNRYGGVAYDYEFGGESTGSVNGLSIRSASIKGGTLRGEFGFRHEATKTNPWKTDISFYGITGKRNGVGGNVAVEYHF